MSLSAHLSVLTEAGLIQLAQLDPELEYLFRHALIQDAAYASLLKTDRRQLHFWIGEILETAYPERLTSGELTAVLARHFLEAGEELRALNYFLLAGEAAAKAYAKAEALGHYSQAITLLQNTPGLASAPLAQAAYLGRGHVRELDAQHLAALADYTTLLNYATEQGDHAVEFAALSALAILRITPTPAHDLTLGQLLVERALQLTHSLNDQHSEARANWLMLLLMSARRNFPEAARYGERSAQLARATHSREQLAFTLNDLNPVYKALGDQQQAQAVGLEANALWRELGNWPMLADNLGNLAGGALQQGDYEQALTFAQEASDISHRIGNLWGQAYGVWIAIYAWSSLGDYRRALECGEETIRLSEQGGLLDAQILARAEVGAIYGELGHSDRAQELFQVALTRSEIVPQYRLRVLARYLLFLADQKNWEAVVGNLNDARTYHPTHFSEAKLYCLLVEAELWLAQGQWALIPERLTLVIEASQLPEHGGPLAYAWWMKGRLALAQGEVEAAYTALETGYGHARAIRDPNLTWKIAALLSEVAERLAKTEAAAEFKRVALNQIMLIVERSPSELGAMFLERAEVKRVVSNQ